MVDHLKTLLLGILLIVLIGIGGLVYRNAVEHPSQPVACPLDAKLCPDGTSVGRTGLSCTFPDCPPPNVTLSDLGIAYAVPDGFAPNSALAASAAAAYSLAATSTASSTADLIIRSYPITASSTALAVMQSTAIGGASGAPAPVTAFTSSVIGTHRFTVVSLERFEGVIDTAYYLARGNDVLRFDAIDRGVAGWTDPTLDVSSLPAHAALIQLLTGLQGS